MLKKMLVTYFTCPVLLSSYLCIRTYMRQCMRFPTMWYCDQQSLRSACAYAQSDQSLCLSLDYSMIVKLLTEHHLEFLSLKGGCWGSSESTYVKMPHCWKSHALSHISLQNIMFKRVAKQYLHKQYLHKQYLHKQYLHKQYLQKQYLHKQFLHKPYLHKQYLHHPLQMRSEPLCLLY